MEIKDYITLTISTLAFIASIISTKIAVNSQKKQIRTTIRDQLSSVVKELITTLADNSVLQSQPIQNRDTFFYSKSSSFSQKISLLARQAYSLIELEPKIAFDVEFWTVAQALQIIGDTSQADNYYRQAIQVSPSDYYKTNNIRGYAQFLFSLGKHQQGRKLFQEALEILDDNCDNNKAVNGYTYEMWFVTEASSFPSPYGMAEECYKNSKMLFESMSDSGYKSNCLQSLEATRSGSPLAKSLSTSQSNV